MYTYIRELLDNINKSPSPWHTVENFSDILSNYGFRELKWDEAWNIKENGSYFTKLYGSSLFAFTLGRCKDIKQGFVKLRISAAHTDFPGFRIKPSASVLKEGYGVLNIEGYGGMIVSTWQDRPLSIAGKVALRGNDIFNPEIRLVDFSRPMMTIPSLAIHMNRKVNEGVALNKQTDILPLTAVWGKEADEEFLLAMVARELGVFQKDILSYELNLYPYEVGCQLGIASEIVSAPRLDNITSCVACIKGIVEAKKSEGLSITALFDNEEIGSQTKQGAASGTLLQLLERIYLAMEIKRTKMLIDIAKGLMLSVDVAHGVHPNYLDKADITSRPKLNNGVVLKEAASQAYAGDAEAVAIIKELCIQNKIPYQQFVNRNDIPGGSTLGSIASTLVPIRTMDVGVPILAMHSARETMGAIDQKSLNDLLKAFYLT